jgi:hypothetical protein
MAQKTVNYAKLIMIFGTLTITPPILKSLKTYFWRVHIEIKINTSTTYVQAENPLCVKILCCPHKRVSLATTKMVNIVWYTHNISYTQVK